MKSITIYHNSSSETFKQPDGTYLIKHIYSSFTQANFEAMHEAECKLTMSDEDAVKLMMKCESDERFNKTFIILQNLTTKEEYHIPEYQIISEDIEITKFEDIPNDITDIF